MKSVTPDVDEIGEPETPDCAALVMVPGTAEADMCETGVPVAATGGD